MIERIQLMSKAVEEQNFLMAQTIASTLKLYFSSNPQPFPDFQTLATAYRLQQKTELLSEAVDAFFNGGNYTILKPQFDKLVAKLVNFGHLLDLLERTYNPPEQTHNSNDSTQNPQVLTAKISHAKDHLSPDLVNAVRNCRNFTYFEPLKKPEKVSEFEREIAAKRLEKYNLLSQSVTIYTLNPNELINENQLTLLCKNLFSNMNSIDKNDAQKIAPTPPGDTQLAHLQILIEESNAYKERYNDLVAADTPRQSPIRIFNLF